MGKELKNPIYEEWVDTSLRLPYYEKIYLSLFTRCLALDCSINIQDNYE